MIVNIIVAVLVALIAAGGTIISTILLRGQGAIHTLVNSNMDALKAQIVALISELHDTRKERDDAQDVAAAAANAAQATEHALRVIRDNPAPAGTP